MYLLGKTSTTNINKNHAPTKLELETNCYLGIWYRPRKIKEVGSTIDGIKIHHAVTIFVDNFIILALQQIMKNIYMPN